MATSLMSHSCGDACKEETQYLVSFAVTSLEMTDEDEEELFSEVLVVITWDGNVVKLMKSDQDLMGDFVEKMELLVHASPETFSKKLKSSPIMVNLSREGNDLGTIKLTLSDCLIDSVLCQEFNSQIVSKELKFVKDDEENGAMKVNFRIEKISNDAVSENLNKTMQAKLGKRVKKTKKDKENSSDKDSNDDSCKDFLCPDELPEQCKQNLGLNQNVYRIINGNLINVKDKIGQKCPVSEKISSLNRYEFNDGEPNCEVVFKNSPCLHREQTKIVSPECNDRSLSSKLPDENYRNRPKDDWIDRNIQEEDLLKKLCIKYGIDADEIRAVGQKVESKKVKKLKKKKLKDTKKTLLGTQKENLTVDSSQLPPTREKFIKIMKRKTRGKYSYEFGNDYPTHRSCLSIEKGAGDAEIVPKNMGWRWDELDVGSNARKWFPGRVDKTVRCLMKTLLNPFPLDTIPLTRRAKNGKILKSCTEMSQLPEFDSDFIQKPTLQIQKRDGEISITMNPLKDNKKLETDRNPYLNCSPLTFKIKKNAEDIKKRRAKKLLLQRGFIKKCSCLDLKCCRCMSRVEKKLLAYEMQQVSTELKLKNLVFADLDDSSDSEMDVEFTTPAAIIENRKFKADVVHGGTQYASKDFLPSKIDAIEKMKKRVDKTILKASKAHTISKSKMYNETCKPAKPGVKAQIPPRPRLEC